MLKPSLVTSLIQQYWYTAIFKNIQQVAWFIGGRTCKLLLNKCHNDTLLLLIEVQTGPENTAQSIMHHHFATVCCRIMLFAIKCSAQITTNWYKHLCQWVKCSLTNGSKWIHIISDVTLQVNMTPLTAEDRLLIKTSRTEKCWTDDSMIVEFWAIQWKRQKSWFYWQR